MAGSMIKSDWIGLNAVRFNALTVKSVLQPYLRAYENATFFDPKWTMLPDEFNSESQASKVSGRQHLILVCFFIRFSAKVRQYYT